MNIKKTLASFIALAIVFGGASVASAQTTTSTSSAVQQVQSLLQQIQQLQEQMNQLKTQQKDIVQDILTTLNAGSAGDAVKILQAVLALDPNIYPEGRITGFFGALTRRAVMNFQRENGLPQVGNVGPRTLEKLKEKLKDNPIDLEDDDNATSTHGRRPCAKVPPGHLIAPGWLRKHDGIRPIVPPCQKLPPGILNRASSTNATSSDTIAPVLSRIRTEEASSSVVVTWLTNEPATSQIFYGTSTTLGSSTTLDAALMTSHSQTITGLEADTTYYFKVESKDAAGNLRTSSQRSFDTDED